MNPLPIEDRCMIVGVPREIKTDEYRVAMIPVGVEELIRASHQVLIQAAAGGIGSTAVQLARTLGAGMIIGTVFTLFVVPAIYMLIARERRPVSMRRERDELLEGMELEPLEV